MRHVMGVAVFSGMLASTCLAVLFVPTFFVVVQRFENWRRDVEIYAYFNNDWEAFAVRNALWLKRRLSS